MCRACITTLNRCIKTLNFFERNQIWLILRRHAKQDQCCRQEETEYIDNEFKPYLVADSGRQGQNRDNEHRRKVPKKLQKQSCNRKATLHQLYRHGHVYFEWSCTLAQLTTLDCAKHLNTMLGWTRFIVWALLIGNDLNEHWDSKVAVSRFTVYTAWQYAKHPRIPTLTTELGLQCHVLITPTYPEVDD